MMNKTDNYCRDVNVCNILRVNDRVLISTSIRKRMNLLHIHHMDAIIKHDSGNPSNMVKE